MISRLLRHPHLPRWAVLAAFVLPLYFALCTDHLWEDFFITFRVSRNLVAGHGMVFQPGERVHTFTSPLGMLLPALCAWVTGGSDPAAIWLFRIVCCGFLAGTAALLLRVSRRLELGVAGAAVVLGLFVFDAKIADFTINGMETAIVLFFFVWMIVALLERRTMALALAVAGLMWTRPDGFIFAGALLGGFAVFIWGGEVPPERRRLAGMILRGLVIGGLIYLPWFLWAWYFYGNPVPNTILAKSAALEGGAKGAIEFPAMLLGGDAWLARIFMPSNYIFGGWHPAFFGYACVLTIPAALYFLWPRASRPVRALSLSLFLGGMYLETIPQFPWYYPWWQVLAMLVVGAIVTDLARFVGGLRERNPVQARRYMCGLGAFGALVLATHVGLWISGAVQMQLNQREIELGVRRPIGEWLHAHARSGDTVMLEPLGYIGYYSQAKMLDWPGLSAPEMTRAIKSGVNTWPGLIAHFKPDWVVLRPREVRLVLAGDAEWFNANYRCEFGLDAQSRIAAHSFYPGRPFAMFDSVFLVYHRLTPRLAGVESTASVGRHGASEGD